MADAKVDNKETTTPNEEVTSTEPTKESPLKKAPVVESEANGVAEHENGDADTPAENGDAEEDVDENGTSENGENGANGDATEEKTESGVKRKSHSGEGDAADVTTPEKKSKTADEPPAEEAAA